MRYAKNSAVAAPATLATTEPKKPVFYNRTAKRPTQPAPIGSKEMDVYEVEIDSTGHKALVKTGKTNVYDRIQASLESTKIENIIRRATAGDLTALAQTNGQYLDCTDMPRSLAEMQNLVLKLQHEFDKLPIEVRKKYDMSAEKYIADYGTEAWAKNLGIVQENEPVNEPTEE